MPFLPYSLLLLLVTHAYQTIVLLFLAITIKVLTLQRVYGSLTWKATRAFKPSSLPWW